MPAPRQKMLDAVQTSLVALALVALGAALILGDVTLPRSPVAGGFIVLAGACYLLAAVMRLRSGRKE